MYCLQWLIPVLLMPKPSNPALVQTHVMFMVLYLIGFFLEKKPCTICSLVFLATVFLICYSGLGNCLIWASYCENENVLLNILLFWNICDSARIIAIMPTPSFSHQIVFQPLWKKLLSRGHEITLLTTEPLKNANLSNLNQIDWSFAYDLWHVKYNFSSIIKNFRQNKVKCFNQFVNMMHDIVIQELEHEDVQKLIHNQSEQFDVAVIEFLYPTMLAFSERFSCPYIGVSSMDVTNFGHDMVGNPTNPAIYTDFLAPYDSKMTFFERILNTLNYIAISLYFHYYLYPTEDVSVKKFFGSNVPELKDIQKKVSMVFLNTHPVLHDVRPLMPNVLQIGGALHLHKLNVLPKDLEIFLNESKNGVIYFSLGSNVKMVDLPKETFNIIMETFLSLTYGIVWKIDATDRWKIEHITKNSSNIFIGNWLPQQEILAHKNMKLFITQGGQQSLEEAIYYGVPMIGMPFYVDQFPNIRRLSRRGVCIILDPENLKKEDLQNAINEVITNETYLNSIKELSSLLREQPPVSTLDQAVWWIEYVIKHKGAKFLKSEVPNMPLYQYLLLDVIGMFIVILLSCLIIQYMLLRYLFKCVRSKVRSQKVYKLE